MIPRHMLRRSDTAPSSRPQHSLSSPKLVDRRRDVVWNHEFSLPGWGGSLVGHLLIVLLSAVFVCFPRISAAGGIVHVFPPSFNTETFAVARLQVLISKTFVTVSDEAIRYRMDQTFFNDNDFPLQGLFILPLEEGKELAEPAVRVNGVPAHFEVVRPERFFPTLRQLTVDMKDPALLGLAGKTVLLVRQVDFGIKEQKTIRVEYETPNSEEDNLLQVFVPLDGERYSLGPVGVCQIHVRFNGSRVVRTLFSHTHHLSVLREAPHRCLASVKLEKTPVRHDFSMLAAFSGRDLDFRLLAHKVGHGEGAFVVFIEPPLVSRPAEEPEKDIVFILDTSGSMGRDDLDTAKRTVIFGLEKLRPGDRFNVLMMKTHPERLARRLLQASHERVLEAVSFVNAASASGGTDLYNSFLNALEQFRSRRRPCMIVFAGHGRGTVGITERETIIEDVKHRNRVRARIFTFAVGQQADMAVLSKLAATNRGSCVHFSGKDSFAATVGRLFSRVAPPLVSDLSLEFQDISPDGVCPDPIPDLFGAEGAVVLGKYAEKHDTVSKVRLKGKVRGRTNTVNRSFTFPEHDPSHPYVPVLWAMRRVGRLLEKEWFKGPEPQSRREIRALAQEFGFRTPFVSPPSSPDPRQAMVAKDAAGLFWLFKTSHVLSDVESDQYRRVGAAVFHLDKRAWVDNRYRSSLSQRTVRFLSDEYFSLVREQPSLGAYLALGPDVAVVQDDAAVLVTSRDMSNATH